MSSSQHPRSRPQTNNSKTFASLLAILFAPQLAHAATQLSFFEHSSCNAGTSFQSYDDPNALQADTSCHQLPNGTTALYVHQIDDGCTLRTYLSTSCDPVQSSLSGLLIPVGNCFYVEEGTNLGSWRADCPGVDYSSTNGLDTGNSYTNNANDGGDNVYSALVTATGAVTLTASTATTSATESAAAATTSMEAEATSTVSSSSSVTDAATTTAVASETASSGAENMRRGALVMATLGVVAVLASLY
ncbi:hypothetical protein LTS15_009501 [Exophiala xenobiotica]|nr:hypothetical protein LTS15_009501 [Exophiala xenobiotica]